jgi:patatin-related protein
VGLDVQQEKRFAVVMYGGVSLAIYINGVAQELYRLVKATAEGAPEPSSGTEKVYYELAKKLNARFVIDILSGTSAGGINAVFLAKALANGQPMNLLEQLWLDEGEIDVLINDKRSAMEGMKTGFASPRSLLNSQRMYKMLLKALNDMEQARDPEAKACPGKTDAGWVKELDLFVTTTDLQGRRTPVSLSDKVVYEYRHRNVFHFQKNIEENRDDFTKETNPFLAFAARCTSSFPFAFEPMRLSDIEGAKIDASWERFYQNYVVDKDQVDENVLAAHPKTQSSSNNKFDVFTQRAFADGGYLDNKPFSYAIDAISARHSDVPVDRKLLYIEPSPESIRDELTILDPPNAIENVLKAFSLARYETIQEDMQRVKARNRLLERVGRILEGTLEDIQENPEKRKPQSVAGWLKGDLQKMISREGIAYGGYLRLRVSKVTDDLAEIITRQAGFAVDSDLFRAVHEVVRAWRDRRYYYYALKGEKRENFNQFLLDFNLRFFLQRLRFTIANIDRIYRLADEKAVSEAPLGARIDEQIRPQDVVARIKSEGKIAEFRETLKKIRRELSLRLEEIQKLRGWLRVPDNSSPLTLAVRGMAISPHEVVQFILGKGNEAAIRAAAEDFVTKKAGQLKEIAAIVLEVVHRADRHSDLCKLALELGTLKSAGGNVSSGEDLRAILDSYLKSEIKVRDPKDAEKALEASITLDATDPPNPSDPTAAAKWVAAFYFRKFPHYDLVAFPMLQAADLGEEIDPVEVIRISPNDAQALSSAGDRKLCGSALMHFGAFFDRTWRKNDILWGRLDGAERIISALLSGTEHEAELGRFIEDAQRAIFEETFQAVRGQTDSSVTPSQGREMIDLLAAALLGRNPEARKVAQGKVVQVSGEKRMKDMLDSVLKDSLNMAGVKDLFRDYEADREVEPRKALEAISRSTQVVGKMLGSIAQEQSADAGKRAAAWITRVGQLLWGIVEISTPKSFGDILFKYWFHLALLIGGVLIFIGPPFSGGETLRRFGISLVLIVFAISGTRWILQDILRRRFGRLRGIITAGASLLAAAILVLITIGIAFLPEAWGKTVEWVRQLLQQIVS